MNDIPNPTIGVYILICDYVYIVGAYSSLANAQAFVGESTEPTDWDFKEGMWSWQRPGKDASGYYEIVRKILDE